MSSSPAVEAAVTHWVERLEHVYDRIQRCHVWVDLPHRHHRHGARFQVRVVVSVPGREIAVGGRNEGNDDVYLALANAFLAARRQLQEHARILRGDVKTHDAA
jgi:ribosome-associated translation inhibitor RaiA